MPTKTQGERIKYVRKLNAMTQEEFGRALGTTRGAVGNWELEKGIKTENLMAIAERFQVSVGWLAKERGPAPTQAAEKPHIDSAHILPIDDTPPDSPQGISTAKPYQPRLPNASPIYATGAGAGPARLPETIVNSEGSVTYAAEALLGEISMPPAVWSSLSTAPPSRLLWLEIHGDSMTPTLNGGDWVGANTMLRDLTPDGLFAFRDADGGVAVKRLKRLRGADQHRVQIVSDREPERPDTEDLENIAIIGRIVGRISRIG